MKRICPNFAFEVYKFTNLDKTDQQNYSVKVRIIPTYYGSVARRPNLIIMVATLCFDNFSIDSLISDGYKYGRIGQRTSLAFSL